MHYRSMMHMGLAIFGICTVLSQSAIAQTRLGLHVTQEELAIWRQRAISGPYKTAGDVSTNSPGDWDRIVANRNAFAANPSRGRWRAPATVSDCVEANTSTYGWPEAASEGGSGAPWSRYLRDAAFHNLVMGVTTDQAAIKQELLWVSSQPFTQWGDPSGPWCFEKLWDSAPSFGITSVLTRVLFAYDYLGRAAFSQSELGQLDRWFFDAADFWRRDMDIGLAGIFVDRWDGNYTRREPCDSPVDPYVGGPSIYSYAKVYNNRRGAIIRFAAMVGLYLQRAGRNYTNGRYGTQADLLTSGKLYAQEYIRFGVFPQGVTGDFERRGDGGLPETGWAYAGAAIGEVGEIADAFTRAGDTSLYTYSTNLGDCGTTGTINDGGPRQGQNRDIKFAIESYMKYMTGDYARYWPDASTEENRIDGRHPRDGSVWHGVHETHLIPANVYFQDTFIKQAYTRTHANSVPYPSNPIAGPPPWMGENAVFPAVLFMFGQMEGKVWPYPGTSTPLNAPEHLRVIPIAP